MWRDEDGGRLLKSYIHLFSHLFIQQTLCHQSCIMGPVGLGAPLITDLEHEGLNAKQKSLGLMEKERSH